MSANVTGEKLYAAPKLKKHITGDVESLADEQSATLIYSTFDAVNEVHWTPPVKPFVAADEIISTALFVAECVAASPDAVKDCRE